MFGYVFSILLLALAGCGSQPPPSSQDIPIYQGAREIQPLHGNKPKQELVRYVADATQTEILSFYVKRLEAEGWRPALTAGKPKDALVYEWIEATLNGPGTLAFRMTVSVSQIDQDTTQVDVELVSFNPQ